MMDAKQIAERLDEHIQACRLTWGPERGVALLARGDGELDDLAAGTMYLAALDRIEAEMGKRETLESRLAELEKALNTIAWEPIGEADASAKQILADVVEIAKDALRSADPTKAGEPGETQKAE